VTEDEEAELIERLDPVIKRVTDIATRRVRENFEPFARAIRAEERERCAKLVESIELASDRSILAQAIRALGDE